MWFVQTLVRESPRRFAMVAALGAASSIGQALGVLLLVPLLGAVGVGSRSAIARDIHNVFAAVGIRATLAHVLIVYVAVTAIAAWLTALAMTRSARYRLEFADELRSRLYAAVGRSEWRHLIELRQSDLLAVLTTNVIFVGVGAYGAFFLLATALTLLAQLGAAVRISAAFTGLAVLTGALLILVIWPLIRRSRRLSEQLMERNRDVTAQATEFLGAIKLAKAYGREDHHLRTFTASLAAARAPEIEFTRAGALATAAQTVLTAALLAVAIEIAVSVLHVPVTALLVVALVFVRMISQLAGAQSWIQALAQAVPALEEVTHLIATCESAAVATLGATAASRRLAIGSGVVLESVGFEYPGRADSPRPALHDVSLVIPAGATIALTGPSGAGKTTIADLVVGLLAPTSGRVLIGGMELDRERSLAWRASVALVPQEPFLFHATVRENLLWAQPYAVEKDLWEALRMAAGDAFVSELPQGLDTVVGDRGVRLSGGERQRLALARALLRRPELLVLDEATSALDTESELLIRNVLAELHGRVTILVIAHRLSTAAGADHVVVLEGGRVVQAGTWAELAGQEAGRLHALISAGMLSPSRGAQ